MTTELAPAIAPLEAPAARPRVFAGIQPSGIVHLGNELGAVRNFVNPTSEVQMGINATSTPPSGYLSIFVQGYEGIQPGQSIPATFAVGDREFKGTFTGQDTAGFGGATVPVDNADFIYSLGQYDELTISYGDDRRVIVPLDDADPAIAALRACQEGL